MAAIITFDNYMDSKQAMNETVSTMGRQLMDSIKNLFKGENWTSNDAKFSNYLKDKKDYFNELYTIKPALKQKLIKWAKQTPGAIVMSPSSWSQMLNANNTTTQTHTTGYQDKYGGYYGSTYQTDVTTKNEYDLQQKARLNNARNSLTYATTSYVLNDGGKAYLLFFTFDSDGIDVCQIATTNKFSQGRSNNNGIEIVRIPQWSGVQKSEYSKD